MQLGKFGALIGIAAVKISEHRCRVWRVISAVLENNRIMKTDYACMCVRIKVLDAMKYDTWKQWYWLVENLSSYSR